MKYLQASFFVNTCECIQYMNTFFRLSFFFNFKNEKQKILNLQLVKVVIRFNKCLKQTWTCRKW